MKILGCKVKLLPLDPLRMGRTRWSQQGCPPKKQVCWHLEFASSAMAVEQCACLLSAGACVGCAHINSIRRLHGKAQSAASMKCWLAQAKMLEASKMIFCCRPGLSSRSGPSRKEWKLGSQPLGSLPPCLSSWQPTSWTPWQA